MRRKKTDSRSDVTLDISRFGLRAPFQTGVAGLPGAANGDSFQAARSGETHCAVAPVDDLADVTGSLTLAHRMEIIIFYILGS